MVQYTVIVPAYNEEKCIKQTLMRLRSVLNADFQIIVVNDASTDKTRQIVDELSIFLNFQQIHNPVNLGYGGSLKRGIEHANGKYIGIVDSDGTYPIELFPLLFAAIDEGYDMAVCEREQKYTDQLLRNLAKSVLRFFIYLCTGYKIKDLNSGMRVFNLNKAKELWKFYPNGFSFTSTLTLGFLSKKYPIKYIPMKYGKRVERSKMKPKHFIAFVQLFLKLFVYFNPIKMLLPVYGLFGLVGVSKGIYDFCNVGYIGTFALICVMIAINVFMMAVMNQTK